MKTIELTKGYVALVDDEDFDKVNEFKWQANEARRKDGSIGTVYVTRTVYGESGTKVTQRLHRFLTDVTDPKIEVDHRDGNGLNNQSENLRISSRTQNQGNSRKQTGTSSKFKGVTWNKRRCEWHAQIQISAKKRHLGDFDSEIEAALAYDTAACALFGDFAHCNFPGEDLALVA